jgi:hypothetical protein
MLAVDDERASRTRVRPRPLGTAGVAQPLVCPAGPREFWAWLRTSWRVIVSSRIDAAGSARLVARGPPRVVMLEAVGQLDLAPSYASYRLDGGGRAAFEPQKMLTLFSMPTRGVSALRAASSVAVWRTSLTRDRCFAGSRSRDARFPVRARGSAGRAFHRVLSLCREARKSRLRGSRARDPQGGCPHRRGRGRALRRAARRRAARAAADQRRAGVGPRWQTPGASSSAIGRQDPHGPRGPGGAG